jgi:hypothetical protein
LGLGSSQQDIGSAFDGLQSEASKNMDENLIYIQHSHNKAAHTSTGNSPFETCFAYLLPLPLDVVDGHQGVREDVIGEALKAEKFVEKINPFSSIGDIEEVTRKVQGLI